MTIIANADADWAAQPDPKYHWVVGGLMHPQCRAVPQSAWRLPCRSIGSPGTLQVSRGGWGVIVIPRSMNRLFNSQSTFGAKVNHLLGWKIINFWTKSQSTFGPKANQLLGQKSINFWAKNRSTFGAKNQSILCNSINFERKVNHPGHHFRST